MVIGNGLEGHPEGKRLSLPCKSDCALFQPIYWMEMVVLGSKEAQTCMALGLASLS